MAVWKGIRLDPLSSSTRNENSALPWHQVHPSNIFCPTASAMLCDPLSSSIRDQDSVLSWHQLFFRKGGLIQGMLQWRPAGALLKQIERRQASAPPNHKSCEQPLPVLLVGASAWDQASARKSKVEKLKKTAARARGLASFLGVTCSVLATAPPSSTELWQTRSERKPWNRHRKPREV